MLTRARVAADDPAFARPPTKPVGAFYSDATAHRLAAARGWSVGPDAGRGWRRMVASPRPLEVIEREHIARLAAGGAVVIGGGGLAMGSRDRMVVLAALGSLLVLGLTVWIRASPGSSAAAGRSGLWDDVALGSAACRHARGDGDRAHDTRYMTRCSLIGNLD